MRTIGSLLRLASVAVIAVLCAGCGASASPSGLAPADTEAPLYSLSPADRLDNALSSIGVAANASDPHRVFQNITAAINDAAAAGIDPESIARQVDGAFVEAVSEPGGAEAMAANDLAVNGDLVTLNAQARTAIGGGPAIAMAANVVSDQAPPTAAGKPPVRFYYINGVLNSHPQAAAAANLLRDRLTKLFGHPVEVALVYNASAGTPALQFLDGCAAAAELPADHKAKSLVDDVCHLAKVCSAGVLTEQTLWDSLQKSFPQLLAQWVADADFASNPVNRELEKQIRADVGGTPEKRVVLISHSQGTLFAKNLIGRLSDLPQGRVASFYFAPAFGFGDNLTTLYTRYVLLQDDAINFLSGSTTTPWVDSQKGSPLHLHFINTYLTEGTPSNDRFLQEIRALVDALGGDARLPIGAPVAVHGGRGRSAPWSGRSPRQALPSPSDGCDSATPADSPLPDATSSGVPTGPVGGNTWAGVWDSSFGQLTLDASGSGSYTGFNPGSVSGSIKKDGVLEGTWQQPGNPPKSGTFRFFLGGNGRGFTGTWAYSSGSCSAGCTWSGSCVSGPCTSNGSGRAPPTGRARKPLGLLRLGLRAST